MDFVLRAMDDDVVCRAAPFDCRAPWPAGASPTAG
jgi:hypothetical protein